MAREITQQIALHYGSNRAVDELELTTFKPELREAYVDEGKNIRKKPGLEFVFDLSTAQIDGLFWWEKQSKAIVISNQEVFKLTSAAGDGSDIVATDITDTDTPEATTKAYFADFGANLYAANGGQILKITSADAVDYIADVDAPTTVSHIAALDTYLLALETGTEKIHYSEVGAPDSWVGEWVSAEAFPDDAKAMAVHNRRIAVWGTDSLQFFYNDGVTPFVPEIGMTVKTGLLAPHAFTFGINTWYWLDDNRNLVRLVGNQVENLPAQNPQSLSLYIQGFTTIDDAIMEYMNVGGRHLISIVFPTEDKTLMYDIIANIWMEWGDWNATTEAYERWKVNVFSFCDAWNLRLIGDAEKGFIYKLRLNYAQEGVFDYLEDSAGGFITDSAGANISTSGSVEQSTIRLLVRTGMINHGSMNKRKFSSRYVMTAKRPAAYTVDTVTVKLRYRDDGKSTWSEFRDATVADLTPTLFRLTWNKNGSYYERQIEIVNEDNEPILLSGILEEVIEYED